MLNEQKHSRHERQSIIPSFGTWKTHIFSSYRSFSVDCVCLSALMCFLIPFNKLKIHLYWCGDSAADALLLGHNSGGCSGVKALIRENCLSLPQNHIFVPRCTIQTPKLTLCFSSFIALCHLTGWKITATLRAGVPVCVSGWVSWAWEGTKPGGAT